MPQLSNSHVFISYSRRDDEVMRQIVAFLRAKGMKVWVDNERLTPGTPIWEEEIEKAISGAYAVVLVLSPDAKKSEWVRREITLTEQHRKYIFPVLVKGDENSSITLRLITRQFVDLRQNEQAGLNALSAALSSYLEELNRQEKTDVASLQIEQMTPTRNVEQPSKQRSQQTQFRTSEPRITRKIIYTWIGILLLIGLSGGGYYMINKAQKASTTPTVTIAPTELNPTLDETTAQRFETNEGEVHIISWAGYVERGETDPAFDWVTVFENQTQCKVTNKIVATSDEMRALLVEGGFDLVTASSDISLNLIYDGLVQAIDINLIPSWEKIDPRLQNSPWHTLFGTHYGVPFQWNANVLMYNTNVFPEAPTSWNVVFEEMILPDGLSNQGRVQAYAQPIYIADAALYLKTHNPDLRITDPFELTQKQFDAAINLLRTQRPLVNRYWQDVFIQMDDFTYGDVVATSAWLFQERLLEAQGEPVSFVIPQEGATALADTLMMQKNAPHPNCAYLWLEHSLEPKVQGDVAAWYGSNPSVPEGCMASELLGQLTGCNTNGFNQFDALSFWKTPVEDCEHGICVPYSKWVEAYQQIISGQ